MQNRCDLNDSFITDIDDNDYSDKLCSSYAYISKIEPMSAAYQANLHCGDQIITINGKFIEKLTNKQICDIIRFSFRFFS